MKPNIPLKSNATLHESATNLPALWKNCVTD